MAEVSNTITQEQVSALISAAIANLPAGVDSTTVQNMINSAVANRATTSALSAVQASIPTPSAAVPPAVADSGTIGNMTSVFALANHTHASKVRKVRIQTAADGTVTWTYSTPFTAGTNPIVLAVAEVASGVTDVVNVQVIDQPTATSCKLLVNRTNRSVVSLIGLTVLSVPSSPGATWVHAVALEP